LSYSCNNDLLSRGLTVEQLASHSFWWHGTAWVMEDRNHHFEDMQRFDRPWSYSGRECVKTLTATCDIFRNLISSNLSRRKTAAALIVNNQGFSLNRYEKLSNKNSIFCQPIEH
ncbi:hypothetical protein T10_5262, partial [Trichinella papuae]